MLITYLTTVVIWMIIIAGTAYLFEDKIRANGWLENTVKTTKNPLVLLFFMSAIPLLRVVFFIAEIMMVAATKEDIDELIEDLEEEM